MAHPCHTSGLAFHLRYECKEPPRVVVHDLPQHLVARARLLSTSAWAISASAVVSSLRPGSVGQVLRCPDAGATTVDPGCPHDSVICKPSDDGDAAISGQGNGRAMSGASNSADADQLIALL